LKPGEDTFIIDVELFFLERMSDRSISRRKNSPECAYFDRGSTAPQGQKEISFCSCKKSLQDPPWKTFPAANGR